MLIYILIALIGVQLIRQIKNQPFNLEQIVTYMIPYWTKGDWEDRLLGIIQLMIIGAISLIEATKVGNLMQRVMVFILVFVSFVWLVKIILCMMEWLQEYIHTMNINIMFTLAIPCIILINLRQMDEWLEVEVCFIALLMSIFIIYMELISIVLGRGHYKKTTKYLMANNALKLKSILTWFFVILVNLYTILLFIQFYMDAKAHHFIEAEVLTKTSAVDLFYYLIVTFTTVGFGDISPHTVIAKMISALIALSGMLFTGVFVGCILNLKE